MQNGAEKKQTEILSNHLGETYLTSGSSSLPDNCFFKKAPFELIELCNYSEPDLQDHKDVLHVADILY